MKKFLRAESLSTDRYDTTSEKHYLLKELTGKYLPHILDDLFGTHSCKDCWEALEQYENETKHKYFLKKKAFTLSDISHEIKERMSFYGLYMNKDRSDMEHIKIKKLKY